ncbi:GGDEF domain-containing protein [Marinobacter salicampi]|uniref:GGDEF domain-containing protein n=1 Tax=Marinobacter salicampi TaxID=435907 RepID=UPI0014082B2E|nr:diguanylate cyclase [Marinobacter salicampi]
MMRPLRTLDQYLGRLKPAGRLTVALLGVPVVGGLDYLTGNEISTSLLYLGPIALAAWYSGRLAGSAVAVLCCISWFLADLADGTQYSHPAIPYWNSLIRLGFFYITAVLLSKLRSSLRDRERLARTDSLTGLYVRREFDSRLKHDLAMAHRSGSALTLAYVDVDDFKAVNDIHGHAGGDQVLRTIGRILGGSVREADTAARVGGDEFALILPSTDGPGARQAISTLTQELQDALRANDFEVTCSIGVVTLLDPAISPEQAIAAADELMYQVKLQGKGAVAFNVLGESARPHTVRKSGTDLSSPERKGER